MGELILGRKDDGTLEIIRADDEFLIDDELVKDMPAEGDYRLEGDVIKIEASGQLLAYVLTEQLDEQHAWRATKTADRPGR